MEVRKSLGKGQNLNKCRSDTLVKQTWIQKLLKKENGEKNETYSNYGDVVKTGYMP